MSAGMLLLPPGLTGPPVAPASGVGGGAPPPRRFTVEEYHQLTELGILTEDDNVELLEGQIVHKMARNPPHDESLENTDYAIRAVLPPGVRVRNQSAITLPADGEPEPDLVVCGPLDKRRGRKPGPSDILLVVEVADSSLASDRTTKQRMYARAAISVYWIVNVLDRRVEIYTDPSGPDTDPRYRTLTVRAEADDVPVVLDGQEVGRVPVKELLNEAA